LNKHWSLVAHLTHDVWQTDRLVGFYQTHGGLHRYQHARSTDTGTAAPAQQPQGYDNNK